MRCLRKREGRSDWDNPVINFYVPILDLPFVLDAASEPNAPPAIPMGKACQAARKRSWPGHRIAGPTGSATKE